MLLRRLLVVCILKYKKYSSVCQKGYLKCLCRSLLSYRFRMRVCVVEINYHRMIIRMWVKEELPIK